MPENAVLVLNAGSSSIKYRLLVGDGPDLASGLVERIGEPGSRLIHRAAGAESTAVEGPVPDHDAGFDAVFSVIDDAGGLGVIGHRVVHGGDRFAAPALVDDEVLAAVRELAPLAPLHNPPAARGIELARARFPGLPQVAVFDTAFHRDMPVRARRYALPRHLADRYGIHRYGFHGISHGYVAARAAEHLDRPLGELALITLHLGNGASAAAVSAGRSIDTSMGLTPLSGLVMGTRGGDVDPGVVFHLHRAAGLDLDQVEDVLTRQSGLVGLAGAADMREVRRRAAAGDTAAAEAIDVFCYRARCCIGAYAAALGRLDAIVFTAGIGEHDSATRVGICAGLDGFGVLLDRARNTSPTQGVRTVSADSSRVAVLVVPTDEEREIARQALAVLRARQ
jgi:acetate kinase